MMKDFYPGQEVVCIRDDWVIKNHLVVNSAPIKGNIYTIRHVVKDREWLGLLLVEIVNPVISLVNEEPSFALYHNFGDGSANFRPVKKTDISIFKKLLAPKVLEPQ